VTPVYADELLKRADLGKPRKGGTLPHLPRDRGDLELWREWLTRALPPADDGYRFQAFARTGVRKETPCSMIYRNGRDERTFRFDRQAELMGRGLAATVIAISNAWVCPPHLTPGEGEDIWKALCIVAQVLTEYDARDETRKWVEQLLDITSPLRGYTLERDGRHDALMALKTNGEFTATEAEAFRRGSENWQRRPVRFVDEQTGEQYVRAGEAGVFVREICGGKGIDHPTLRARLSEIGVERCYFEHHSPPHPKLTLYRLTEELVEHVEGEGGLGQGGGVAAAAGGVSSKGERMAF
jgi:hypothetical protein